jgi:hypothetical protein
MGNDALEPWRQYWYLFLARCDRPVNHASESREFGAIGTIPSSFMDNSLSIHPWRNSGMSHEISKRVIGIWSISSFGDIMIHEE